MRRSWLLRRRHSGAVQVGRVGSRLRVRQALVRLGVYNGRRSPGRSLLTAGLIASATFIIVTVAASKRDPATATPRRESGNGGFALYARSSLPLYRQLNTPGGQEDLNLAAATRALLSSTDVEVHGFRVRPGDETSCLNLYRPQTARFSS